MMRIGQFLFAVGLVGFGVLHFVYGDFVTRVVPDWPAWIPVRRGWVYLTGTILIVTGAAVFFNIKARLLLMVLATVLLLSFALLHLPQVFPDAIIGGNWTSAGKALVLFGGALAVAATLGENKSVTPSSSIMATRLPLALGRVCLALFMILGGAQHFRWIDFVVTLVPAWVPGGGLFWTYCSAVFLIAGGLGMLIPRTTRLAATLSGVMIFLWVFMLHVPRVVQGVGLRSNETTAAFEALAFSGLAFIYAATFVRSDAKRHSVGDSVPG